MVSVAPSGLLLCHPGVLRGFHQWWRIISRRLLFKRVDLAYRIFGSLKQPVSPQLKKPVKSKFMADINSRTFWTLSATSLLVSVTSPIYRTHSIIGSDLVKNHTRCWGLTSWQTPCSIFIYSSPSVSQHQPCPSYPSHSQHSMASLVPPCLLVLSDPLRSSSVVDGGLFFGVWIVINCVDHDRSRFHAPSTPLRS